MLKFKRLLVCFAVMIIAAALSTCVAHAETRRAGTITGSVVNVRVSPKTSSRAITKFKKGKVLLVVSKSSGWYKVSFSGKKGWVSGKYIKVKYVPLGNGKVIVSSARVRSKATTSSKIVTNLKKNQTASVLSSASNWYKVKTRSKKVGWVRKDLMKLYRTSISRSATDSTRQTKRESIVSYAKQFLGCQYVYGGSSPSGFDCSGFTQYVMKHFGISLNRTAASQASQGTYVSKSNLLPGDLCFFGGGSINHAALYIGGGKFIHAANTRKDVCISSLSESYYVSHYVTSRRVIH